MPRTVRSQQSDARRLPELRLGVTLPGRAQRRDPAATLANHAKTQMLIDIKPPAPTPRNIQSRDLLAAAAAADLAGNAASIQEERRAVMEVLRHREAIQIGLMQAKMNRISQTPRTQERLPVREDGDDIGVVEARIPRELFFHLLQQKNFGWEGLTSDEGMRDLKKTHPVCAVKTVSGKTTVGWRRPSGVNFGRGTLVLAK